MLCQLHNDYSLAPDKTKIKKEMLLLIKIAEFYYFPNGNVKQVVPNSLDKENNVLHYENYSFI